jgi:hypothetical protein
MHSPGVHRQNTLATFRCSNIRHSVVFFVHSSVVEMHPRVCTALFNDGDGAVATLSADATAAGGVGVDVSAAVVGGGAAVVDSSGASRTTFSFQSGSSSDSTCSSYQAWSARATGPGRYFY